MLQGEFTYLQNGKRCHHKPKQYILAWLNGHEHKEHESRGLPPPPEPNKGGVLSERSVGASRAAWLAKLVPSNLAGDVGCLVCTCISITIPTFSIVRKYDSAVSTLTVVNLCLRAGLAVVLMKRV